MKCVKSCFLLSERLAGWLLQQNSLGSSYLDKTPSTLSEHSTLTGSVIQLFIFPSLSKLAGLFQSNLKTSEKEARQLASWVGKKWFQIVLSVNFLSGQRLARTMELNECFQRHTENGPDYHHQLPTKNYQKTVRCILCWRILRDSDCWCRLVC